MAPSVKSINKVAVASLSNISPVTVSIAPLVVDAEGELQIEGSGFDAGATVRAAGIPVVGKTNGELRSKSVSATKLCVYVPSMEEIQKTKATVYGVTYSYSRNAVLMPLALTVCNSDGSSFGPIALLLRLPAPGLGLCRTEGTTVLIGEPAGNDQGTDHLGGKAPAPDADGGELRWYSKDQLDALSALKVDVSPQWSDAGNFWSLLVSAAANPASFLTDTVWKTLADTRKSGQPLPTDSWHDDGVKFEVPLNPADPMDPLGCGYGIVVAWRDDLPSRPLLVDVTPHPTTINDIPVLGLEGVLSGVPLPVFPGEVLRIVGTNIDTATKVQPIGVAVGGVVGGSLRVHDGGPGELQVYVPSMAELETTSATVTATQLISLSYSYQRNTVLIPFGLQLVNPDGASSGPIMMVATLPPPTIGKVHLDNDIVTIGSIAGEVGTHDLGSASSAPDGQGGQIRWYGLDQLSLIPSVALQAPSLTAGGLWNFLLGLAGNPSTAFFNSRDVGTPVGYRAWADDGLSFQLPSETVFGTGGMLVVWRDDIPSMPQTIWNFGFDCADSSQVQFVRGQVQQAAAALWQRVPTFDLSDPLEPGQTVNLVMERVVTVADNFLAKLLDTPNSGFGIQFRYEISAAAICLDGPNDATSYLESLVPKVVAATSAATLAVEPEIVSQKSGGKESNTVSVQLYVWVQLPHIGCNDLLKDIPAGQFYVTQKTIPVPTVAVFFIDIDYSGPPLFVLPASETLPELPSGMRWDYNGIWMADGSQAPAGLITLNGARDKVVEALKITKGLVDAANAVGFFTSAPWLSHLQELSDIVDGALSGAQFVVDTTGDMWSLWRVVWGNDWLGPQRFTNAISSVLLIGQQASSSGISYQCFWDVNDSGIQLILSQPNDHYISGLSDLSCLAISGSVAGYDLDTPTWDDTAGQGDWHDNLTSIRIVES